MTCIPFPKAPIRAIIVEPYDKETKLWRASFVGDDWTRPIDFKPIEKIGILLPLLRNWQGRNGIPIVVIDPPQDLWGRLSA